MDTAKMGELCAFSQTAYAAEMAGNWSDAHDLHEAAIMKWGEFSNMAIMASTRRDLYQKMALQKCALHRERIVAIRPFAKEGKPRPTMLAVHPSEKLMQRGLWDRVGLQVGPVSPDQLNERMPLTLVGGHRDTLTGYANAET